MMRYLPITELWFNIILRILITIYWATWLWNLLAYTPNPKIDDDDELFNFNKASYIFRLITSLLFLLFWISEFKNEILVYLTVIEIVIIILAYLYLLIAKANQSKKQIKRLKEQDEYKKDLIRKWY